MGEPNYHSGEDYEIEFLQYRFSFKAEDFLERVTAAAVRLGLVEGNDLDEDEAADLVELTADQRIEEARSSLGRYLVRHWEARHHDLTRRLEEAIARRKARLLEQRRGAG